MPTINKPKYRRIHPSLSTNRDYIRRKIYDSSRWRNLRALKLMNNPTCELCASQGLLTPAEDIHHIHSFVDGKDWQEIKQLAYDYQNLMSLCKQCHQALHNQG